MPNFKNARLSEDIKREISGLIRERIKDPRVKFGLVSVVRTELSGDNSHCKVYISHLDGMDASKNAVKGLESASWMIRREISNKLHLKKCPELKFIADDSIEHSAEIAKMLEDMDISDDSENGGGEEE
ncbi:MAG: 30S ribosome-binding factor RbfA [Oscillospiraceae bacterium]|nr:30S ribosome-binding factor RbfA [Oscillospiraceae bacterium]MCI7499252.1 30S ribosome-binding factor RbfA [Oscillospiraceae bacterium]MDD7279463.1 30S ribosome-binding factor RbfA [Oscillospiraceae bacterium]MDY2864431.1 30S ribosome-binding factor RbfA [Oscillospiraceae bacterium]